jgi:hypothetical protein
MAVMRRLTPRRLLDYAARLAISVALLIAVYDYDYGAAFALTLVILIWAVLDLAVWVVRDRRSA